MRGDFPRAATWVCQLLVALVAPPPRGSTDDEQARRDARDDSPAPAGIYLRETTSWLVPDTLPFIRGD